VEFLPGFLPRVERAKVERDWRNRGFSCDMRVVELMLWVEGELEMEMQGKFFSPELGEEIVIPENVVHSVHNVGGMSACRLYSYKEEPTIKTP